MNSHNRTALRVSTLVAGLLIPFHIYAANQAPASQSVQAQVDKRTADAAEQKQRVLVMQARLTQNIGAAREQLKIAELLGYGDKKDYKPMYQQIDELDKKTAGGKSGAGWFDKIRQQLAAWL
ncbi:hypothetical protein [Massilia sp. CCM 8734]|uniref:hypothetical protein n=1 Tax=Massilia sp. CCM 8734 TaxID=2609283 RepID=UPI00142063D8|nr:hypothetical protein [Massilia sp. CCM 8734]NIA00610.1 hypothetical protein [Massilia sp. CCM 8734]